MEPPTVDGSDSGSSLVAGGGRDWSRLPEDLLVSVVQALHVADAIRSSAVCTSWNAAYAAFRRLRVPSLPRQPPCLLYASDALEKGAAALHCPATGAALRIPFPLAPLARRPLLGSGHGWLVTADEVSDLHLLNPVTGAQIALPPITAIHHVRSGTDEEGNPAYLVYENLQQYSHCTGQFFVDTEPTILDPLDRAHEYMYYRVVLSASPSAGRACVVLLLHMPQGEVSFARLGDDRWTWVAADADKVLPSRYGYRDAMYSAADGLFYLLRYDASICSLDLNGPSPVACKIFKHVPKSAQPNKCLVQTPAGDILQVWRFRDYVHSATPVDLPPDFLDDQEVQGPCLELRTTDLQLYKVDIHGQRMELIESLPDYALFIGFNGSMCLPVKDFPGLKSNCVYVTDDSEEYVNAWKYNRRDIGIWSIEEKRMSKLVDESLAMYPWLNWPSPIWIKPSFF